MTVHVLQLMEERHKWRNNKDREKSLERKESIQGISKNERRMDGRDVKGYSRI